MEHHISEDGKMNKTTLIFVGFIFFIVIAGTIIYYNNKSEIDYINKGQKFDHKIYYSPKERNEFTVLLHTVGVSDYYSYIYIINGKFVKNTIPKTKNFIKFPDGTGIYIEWINEEICNIFCDNAPEINNLKTSKYKVNIIVDIDKIDSLRMSGKVIRYTVKPYIPKE